MDRYWSGQTRKQKSWSGRISEQILHSLVFGIGQTGTGQARTVRVRPKQQTKLLDRKSVV